jgi:hypothetical protein
MIEDGNNVPAWLANKDYNFDYKLNTAALIRVSENIPRSQLFHVQVA